jgi:hypothetical protein
MFTETTTEKRRNLKRNSIILKISITLEKVTVILNLKVLSCDLEIELTYKTTSII